MFVVGDIVRASFEGKSVIGTVCKAGTIPSTSNSVELLLPPCQSHPDGHYVFVHPSCVIHNLIIELMALERLFEL